MICTALHETDLERKSRIDSMLREMVVEEALDALEAERLHKSYTIQEIADFVGVGFESMRRIEEQALSNLKLKMLRLEN